ncbi:MAG: hypothetical protein KBS96_03005 [Lachnospiraceae bacterium]|nr:hypothetical protein [Candidatus Colinaster scatohippi]
MKEKLIISVKDADKVLVGIGETWDNDERSLEAYKALFDIIRDKDYYVISLCKDGVIEMSGIDRDRIVSPNDETDEKWEAYNQWLSRTLNRKLCLLELGVGLKYPTIIRWPFEKIAFFNNKAVMYRIHKSLFQTTEELGDKCIGIKADPLDFVL